MAEIADALRLENAQRSVADLVSLRSQTRQILGGMVNIAMQYKTIRATAADAADTKALDDKFAESISMAATDIGKLDAATRKVLDDFIDAAFGKQNKAANAAGGNPNR